MSKSEPMTIIKNFKVSAPVEEAIRRDASEHGMSISEYIRFCVYFAGPVLLSCPTLKYFNRQELAELAANIGNGLVIRPATCEYRQEP